ncbi:MAG: Ni/Fe-hydrogenase, b-type cytochrome subunit [Gemmatimonadetes bacterium]|nr:Ni/Fe-hydrogenase, b-type cytochrome subunit [Gemmatimonadota bacterium]
MTALERPPRAPRMHLGSEAQPPTGKYQWIYLWELPIRVMHWTAAVAIVVLATTGLYIGKPFFMTGGEASSHYLMGWVRFLHFSAAAVLVTTGIVRVYWLFAGNRFERLAALFPIRPRDWANMVKQVKYYLMIKPGDAPQYLGHNPLQQLSYTGIYALTAVMVVTGFAMYGQSNPDGMFYRLFQWLVPLLGGIQIVRFIHHVSTWIFLIFIPIHVYLAMRGDVMERSGTISSIISGGRFVRSDVKYVDE